MLKKLFSIILVLTLVFTAIPLMGLSKTFAVSRQDKFMYGVNYDGTGVFIMGYSGSLSGELNIPAEIDGLPVTEIGRDAFKYYDLITSVIIPDSVTKIEEYAFCACTELTSVTIPDSVTYIAKNAFYYCLSLENIEIPDSVTNIGEWAFYETAYYNDPANWQDNVMYIGKHLIKASYDISGSYTVKEGTLYIVQGAFSSCRNLTSIIIPNGVKAIGEQAFADCERLSNIEISDSVTNIGTRAFASTGYYSNHQNWVNKVLYIGKHLIAAKDNINGAYFIKQGTLCVSDLAFYGNLNLTNIIIPDSVISIGSLAFNKCSLLDTIIVDMNNAYYKSVDGVLFDKNVTELIVYPAGKHGKYTIPNSVTSIAEYSFGYCNLLTGITIPNSVTNIGNEAFYGCEGLTSVTIPNSVTNIKGFTFFYCSSLKSITIPDSVTNIGNEAFYGCTSLISVTVGKNVEIIGSAAFCYCSSLSNITVSDKVKKIGGMAFFDTAYYNNEANWQDNVLYVGKYLIKAKDSVGERYVIKDGTLCIADWAFSDCTMLTDVTIPYSVVNIGYIALGYYNDIYENDYVILDGFTLRCYLNSEGHNYAMENDFDYKIIGEDLITRLNSDSEFQVKSTVGALTGVTAGMTVADVLSQFSGDSIEVAQNGTILDNDEVIGTGCVIQLVNSDIVIDTLTVVVKGDLDGDGEISVKDARKALRAAVGLENITDYQTLAGDIDNNNIISISDARTILRVAVGLQVF